VELVTLVDVNLNLLQPLGYRHRARDRATALARGHRAASAHRYGHGSPLLVTMIMTIIIVESR
jgi:hypothetical protein